MGHLDFGLDNRLAARYGILNIRKTLIGSTNERSEPMSSIPFTADSTDQPWVLPYRGTTCSGFFFTASRNQDAGPIGQYALRRVGHSRSRT